MSMYQIPWELSVLFLLLGIGLGIVYYLTRTTSRTRWTLYGGVASLILGVVLSIGGLIAGIPWDLGSQPALSSPDAPLPLRSRVYSIAPANDILREAILTAESQQSLGGRWRVIAQRATPISGGTFQAAIPSGLWNDSLAVSVRPEAGGIQVDVQARSPVGVLSLGAPRREAAQFLAALDARLAAR